MPRLGDIQFVASQTANAAKQIIPLTEIPEEIGKEVEEIYQALRLNPGGRMRVKYSNKGELMDYINYVTSYCAQRPGGPLRFRKSPSRQLPDGWADFRITDPMTAAEEKAEQAAEQVQETVAAPEATESRNRGRK